MFNPGQKVTILQVCIFNRRAERNIFYLGRVYKYFSFRFKDKAEHVFLFYFQASPFLSMDLLESCFPYTLLRNAYHSVHKGVQPPFIAT